MAASDGDVLKFTFCQRLFAQDVCNVFYYLIDEIVGTPGYGIMIDRFVTIIVDIINEIQSDEVTNLSVRVDNVTNNLDFLEQQVAGTGDRTGVKVYSPQTAWPIKFQVGTKLTRAGGKRIAGIDEDQSIDGVISEATRTSVANGLAEMSTELFVDDTFGNTCTLTPVIVGRDSSGNLDLSRINPITDVSCGQYVTTQNSRKYGRGD